MKNILIPTAFESDTLDAMKIASGLLNPFSGNMVLTTVSDLSDSIQELLFLSPDEHVDQRKRMDVIKNWKRYREKRAAALSLGIQEHHQFGLSRPLLNSVLEQFNIDLVIVPASFQGSVIEIHKFFVELLYRSDCPIMLMPFESHSGRKVKRALLLDGDDASVLDTIKRLPLDIVHQSLIEDNNTQSLRLLIDALDIELVVQPKRKYVNIQRDPIVVALGVPVLSV